MGLNFGVFQVQLVGLDEESSEFICRNTFDHPYPTTKLMWIPDTKGVYPDLLATSGDYLRVWRVSRCSVSSQTSRLLLAAQRYEGQTGVGGSECFNPGKTNGSVSGTALLGSADFLKPSQDSLKSCCWLPAVLETQGSVNLIKPSVGVRMLEASYSLYSQNVFEQI